jgi:hypothetical protein
MCDTIRSHTIPHPIPFSKPVTFKHAHALIFSHSAIFQCKVFQKHLEFFKRNLKNWTPVVLRHSARSSSFTYTFPSGDDAKGRAMNVSGGGDEHDRKMFCYFPQRSREEKMEVVSRLLIRKFKCKVTGGFIRDWVINGQSEKPGNADVTKWIEKSSYGGWEMVEGVIPKDIDVELAAGTEFDILRFMCLVRACGISVDVYDHKPQRHCFVFNLSEGPFTIDIIGNVFFIQTIV